MKEKQENHDEENFGGGNFSIDGFIEKIKDKIPFVKKSDVEANRADKEAPPAVSVAPEKYGGAIKAFKIKPQPDDLLKGFSEYMKNEGMEKVRSEDRKKLENAEKELAEFEEKYSKKHGESPDPKERDGYKLKRAFLEEEVKFLRKIIRPGA